MNEQDKKAFAKASKDWATKSAGKDLGEYFWQAALEYARGQQEQAHTQIWQAGANAALEVLRGQQPAQWVFMNRETKKTYVIDARLADSFRETNPDYLDCGKMIDVNPVQLGQLVAWQFFQDGKWHNGMDTNNHRENTEAAGIPTRDLYTTPPAQPVQSAAQQEPVAWMSDFEACKCRVNPSMCFSDRVFGMMQKYTHPAQPVQQYFYKVDGCKAKYANSPDCICWHDIGAGPLANEPQYQASFREKPQPVQPAVNEQLLEALELASSYVPDDRTYDKEVKKKIAAAIAAAAINEQLLEALKFLKYWGPCADATDKANDAIAAAEAAKGGA